MFVVVINLWGERCVMFFRVKDEGKVVVTRFHLLPVMAEKKHENCQSV
jgi:hypothetical protein